MVTRVADSAERIRQRGPLPELSFNVRAALASSAIAAAGCILTLSAGHLPTPASSITLFTAAPLCALLALPVVIERTRAEGDDALAWVAAGLTVATFALVLQLISFPTVGPGGGPLRTADEGGAQLYLSFHAWLYGSCLAGALGVPRRAARPVLVVGIAVVLLQSLNLFASPELLNAHQAYTVPLLVVEWLLTALALVAVTVWTRASGPSPTPLRGWVSVSLLFSTYELALNALAAQRYDALWWSSLTMRAAGFAVLAGGWLRYLLRQARRVEQFSTTELALRDQELQGSVALTDRLLVHARELARSHTPEQVAATLCATVRSLTAADRVSVVQRAPDTAGPDQPRLVLTATAGISGPGDLRAAGVTAGAGETGTPGIGFTVPRTTGPLYLESRPDIDHLLPTSQQPPSRVRSMALLPLVVGDLEIGALLLEEHRARAWSGTERELLEGLADQAAPVLSRARLAAREHRAAETLQRSLLPGRLPRVPGLRIAARYRPASREEHVGGDFYDGWSLPDGRLALVIGDVVGKGLLAAAATGRLRASVRALAWADPSPGRVLTQLDRIEAEDSEEIVGTVLYVLFEADLGAVRIARAGHPPAILATPDRPPWLIETPGGTPLGLAVQPIPECRVELSPGSTLLLYTDGLVEERAQSLQDRLAELLATVADQHQPGAPDRLATELMDGFSTRHEDDVALLAAARRAPPPGQSCPPHRVTT